MCVWPVDIYCLLTSKLLLETNLLANILKKRHKEEKAQVQGSVYKRTLLTTA